MLVLMTTGCSSDLQKKFIRKRTKPPKPVQIEVEKKMRPYAELYKEHFNYWKNWHRQLIQDLGTNRKREAEDAREAHRQLAALAKYLQEEKAAQVRQFADRLWRLTGEIREGSMSQNSPGLLARELQSLQGKIESTLDYRKMKDFLLPTPVSFAMDQYQGDEPMPEESPEGGLKPGEEGADTGTNADNLSYERYRSLPGK